MFSIGIKVGRLLEIRLGGTVPVGEIDMYVARTRAAVSPAPDGGLVCAMDLRALQIMPKILADRFLEMMRMNNAKLVRSAFLIAPNDPMLEFQIWRLMLEAQKDMRRTFTKQDALELWLGELLDGEEMKRLQRFFKEG